VHSDNKRIANITFNGGHKGDPSGDSDGANYGDSYLPSTSSMGSDTSAGAGSLLMKMQDNLVRSLLSNMHSIESDCPPRESVWVGQVMHRRLH
jgi:hypothetical protein